MPKHYNKDYKIGNLTTPVDLNHTKNNTPVANFGIAVNRNYKSGGDWEQDTLFMDVTVWDYLAEDAESKLEKGDRVFLEGYLQLDKWESDGHQNQKIILVAEKMIPLDQDSPEDAAPDEILDEVDAEDDKDIPF